MVFSKQTLSQKVRYFIPLFVIAWIFLVFETLPVQAKSITPENVLALMNESRVEAGLPVLSLNATLTQAADAKASDMLKGDYFAHTSPTGKSPWYWIKRSGYRYRSAGENLAINYYSAEEQHTAWMKSETHRANILSPKFEEIGIAIAEGKINAATSLVVTVVFASPIQAIAKKEGSSDQKSETSSKNLEVETPQSVVLGANLPPEQETALTPTLPIPFVVLPALDPKFFLYERLILAMRVVLSCILAFSPWVFVIRGYRNLVALLVARKRGLRQILAPG